MIYPNPDRDVEGFSNLQLGPGQPDPDHRALTFLEGEGSILCLRSLSGSSEPELRLVEAFTSFVRAARASDYQVRRAASGEVLLECFGGGLRLFFDGRTAEVLRRWLDGEPTRISDRMQMTIRGLRS